MNGSDIRLKANRNRMKLNIVHEIYSANSYATNL